MASRLQLQEEFCDILQSRNVYYNPPQSVLMKYDAIRYSKSSPSVQKADNTAYRITERYDGVVITRDPDSDIPMKLLSRFPMISIGDMYVSNNLNHFPFTLYY